MADKTRLSHTDLTALMGLVPESNFLLVKPQEDSDFISAEVEVRRAAENLAEAYSRLMKAEIEAMKQAKRFYTELEIEEAQWTIPEAPVA